jgi:MFS family permease
LIYAPSSGFLIAAGALQGFMSMATVVAGAMTYELVPAEQMGRWMGIVRFFRMLLNAAAAYLAGILWDKLGPQYLFITVIGIDLAIRLPLLLGMPETLTLSTKSKR